MSPWTLPLDGDWTLRGGPERPGPHHPDDPALRAWRALPATVPGCAELALVAAGIEPDPRVGDAAWRFQAYEDHEWWWERVFTLAEPVAGPLELVCEALEGLATLWLDGREIGRAANGLIAHRFAIPALAAGPHRLSVRFASTVRAGRTRPTAASEYHVGARESLALRLAGHQFGWDILPRLLGTGIPRGVRLAAVPAARIRGAYWATTAADPAAASARVVLAWDAVPADLRPGWRVRAHLARGAQRIAVLDAPADSHAGRVQVDVTAAALWWPRGWGEAALYDAVVELVAPDGAVADARHECIGLRTVALLRGPGDFAIAVNGRRLWARGTNWVPLDALHARDAQHRDAALALVADLDCNVLRMWGGNRYEDDAVYDWCDANGVLVWQDFALACGVYPQDDAFAAALAAEAEAVIRRLRNHPCLALWCGGNETDEAHEWSGLGLDPRLDRPTRQTLPAAVRQHDPLRPYLPNSPCLDGPGPPAEVHLWGPRDDWRSPYYTACPAAFISETGFHGCPAEASLAAMQPAGAPLWPLTHARWNPQAVCATPDPRHPHTYRNALLVRQAGLLLGAPPDNLGDLVIASQITQAEADKALFERMRIAKGRTWGMLWWNLRDGWPVISDAVVDHFGRRKLAYAVLKRSHARVVPLIAEAAHGRHRIVVVNDTWDDCPARLVVRDLDGGVLFERDLAIAPDMVVEAGAIPAAARPGCWSIELHRGGTVACNHALVGERPYALADLRRWYRALGLVADGVEV